MNFSRYSPETIATLRDMRATGAAYATIRNALGNKSRSAVAGLVTRYCADLPK